MEGRTYQLSIHARDFAGNRFSREKFLRDFQLVFVAEPMKHEFLRDARKTLGPQSLSRALEDMPL